MYSSTYTTATTVSTLFPLPESRILVYEKDGTTLKPIKIYYDDSGRKWVEARPDTRFVIEIKNNCGNNALAVVSVDGLNVIDGKRAELKNERGYVIDRYSSTKISGWRTSLDEVREFVFTDNKDEDFSHKLGADEDNTGVIGIAMFKEKTASWIYHFPYYPYYISSPTWVYNTTTTALNSGTTDSNLRDGSEPLSGTIYSVSSGSMTNCTSICNTVNASMTSSVTTNGILNEDDMSMSTMQGDVIEDSATEVNKEFDELPSWTDVIYYDSYENLVKKGIIKKTKGLPKPFANNGFCPSL